MNEINSNHVNLKLENKALRNEQSRNFFLSIYQDSAHLLLTLVLLFYFILLPSVYSVKVGEIFTTQFFWNSLN